MKNLTVCIILTCDIGGFGHWTNKLDQTHLYSLVVEDSLKIIITQSRVAPTGYNNMVPKVAYGTERVQL